MYKTQNVQVSQLKNIHYYKTPFSSNTVEKHEALQEHSQNKIGILFVQIRNNQIKEHMNKMANLPRRLMPAFHKFD